MKKAKVLTMLGILMAMGLTACGGGNDKSSAAQGDSSNEPVQSQSQGGEQSSQQGGASSEQGGASSEQGGASSQEGQSSSQHEHEFGEWAQAKAATYTELGSEERVCACGEKETRDVNTVAYDIDASSEIVKLNGDNKKVSQFTYNNGAAKVAAVPMKEISGGFKTNAVSGESEKWTIGDDANQAAANTYKLSNSGTGMAILFKVNVTSDINNALISIGGKYKNDNPRYFSNHGDGGQNGDNPDNDAYRYYTKVNDGEFQPIAYNNLMSSVFGDGSAVKYMPLGKFNLKAGDNLIYVRQSNLGYRVTLEGYLYVDLGANGEIGGTVPTHTHTPATAWSSDASEHWNACVGENCDEEGVKLNKAEHTFGEWQEVSAATQEAAGSEKRVCSVCGYEDTRAIPQLAIKDWVKDDLTASIPNASSLTKQTYADGIIGYKWNSATNAKATFTYTATQAGKLTFRLLLSAKKGNEANTTFWTYNNSAKTKVTFNNVEVPAPADNFNMSACKVESATAKDGGVAMMEPVWFDIFEADLIEGVNTIQVDFVAGSFSYFLCGAGLYK